jgi:hypothetical protein
MSVALSGNDTAVLNNHLFSDFADQNCVELTFPTEIASVKTGKNGNSIYGLNETGKQSEVKWRLLRGSADDQFLNNLLVQQQSNFAGFPLMQGTFIKKIGDGLGNITSDTYIMSGGIFTKQVDAKMNVEGDTEQSIVIYTMKFSNAPRAIT